MVAKIGRGASLYGTVVYNQQKVAAGTARLIGGNRIPADIPFDPGHAVQRTLMAFENYLAANRNTEKPVLHISLNPSPEDRLSDAELAALARDYMREMGYGDQPYAVYLHEDTGRRHIHIVSTAVNERGEKIDDSYEWRRSMRACRALEEKYGLKRVADKRQELTEAYLRKADYRHGDLKRQLSNILRSFVPAYRFQTFGEFSALLSRFNVEARQVRGEHDGQPYTGVVYSVTDDDGHPQGPPIPSSRIDRLFGAEALARRMQANARDFRSGKWRPAAHDNIALAMHASGGDRGEFLRLLRTRGLDAVFRMSDEGRIYGVTFIDHNTRQVFNGSRLGPDFSANAFERFFCEETEAPAVQPAFYTESPVVAETLESALEQAFGAFTFERHGEDYAEEAFARRLRKKKCKRRQRTL